MRKPKASKSRIIAAAPVAALVSTSLEIESIKAKLVSSKKKIASVEKSLDTMRGRREEILARYRQLQRQLADEALIKAE